VAAALGGAGIMLAIHATDAGAAFFSETSGVDWNVVFLLLGGGGVRAAHPAHRAPADHRQPA
jgi:hypothetical protein